MKNIALLAKDELELIDKSLNNLFEKNNEVFNELGTFLNSPQKRIRSLVTILYLKSFSKEINLNLLLACELIHNASLLHDDVLDNADLRRGITTICKKFNPNISILSGDYLLSLATENLIKIQNWDIITRFQNCVKNMSEAEILQYSLRGKIPTEQEYLKIIKGKTAELFTATLEGSAILSNLDKNKAKKFAENFGILFQLKNDLEKNSAKADKKNKIYTLKDILGIAKTQALMDNYLEEIRSEIGDLPQNIYSRGVERLLGLI